MNDTSYPVFSLSKGLYLFSSFLLVIKYSLTVNVTDIVIGLIVYLPSRCLINMVSFRWPSPSCFYRHRVQRKDRGLWLPGCPSWPHEVGFPSIDALPDLFCNYTWDEKSTFPILNLLYWFSPPDILTKSKRQKRWSSSFKRLPQLIIAWRKGRHLYFR